MTRQKVWNCVLTRLGFAEPEPRPSLDERIRASVLELEHRVQRTAYDEIAASLRIPSERLSRLEERNESVDATYIRTVTLALSEAQDRRDALINDRYNRLEAHLASVELELRGLTEACHSSSQNAHQRIDALIRKLRAGLE